MEDGLPTRRRGVDRLGKPRKVDLLFIERSHQLDEVGQWLAQAVEAPHDQRVLGRAVIKRITTSGALGLRPTHFISKVSSDREKQNGDFETRF
jgi:hypothetical protein